MANAEDRQKDLSPKLRVIVVGQGYVGLPLAMRCVDVGYQVYGFDTDSEKVQQLNNATSPIDDVSDAQVSLALGTGRYFPTTDLAAVDGFDVAVITVPTPLLNSVPDTSFIESAGREIAKLTKKGSLVILESTSYPGTTEDLLKSILEEGCGLCCGEDFSLAFSPERIDPGNKSWTLQSTPKLIAGVDSGSVQLALNFYKPIVDNLIVASGIREAEFAKLLENTYRQVNIALVNELAIHAKMLGIDIWEVIRLAATKPFGFTPFYPGPGVGGHCLPIDPEYLSWKFQQDSGRNSDFIKLATSINKKMPEYVVSRLKQGLESRGVELSKSKILVLGVSYKKNSSDVRESPAVEVVSCLEREGANVLVLDPKARVNAHTQFRLIREMDLSALESADAVLILTDHDEVDYQTILQKAGYIFDVRHSVIGENVEYL